MTDDDDQARLRRQLRAMAAVNEHLRMQLDALRAESGSGGPGGQVVQAVVAKPPASLRAAARRGRVAVAWTDVLVADAESARLADPMVVTRADRSLYIVEGTTRRRLAVTLIAPALEVVYGERRPIADDAFHALTEGPPVEVLEGPAGGPFVIVGGRRLAVRGLGLPHGVDQEVVDALPGGPPVDVAAAVVARRAVVASDWVVPLTETPTPSDAYLAAGPDNSVVVVDGGCRRSVPAGLLVPALEAVLGQRRPVSEPELAELGQGPPVEVLEGRSGRPYVVVGGRRLPVSGIPLTFPIGRSALDALPEGPTLDLPASLEPRRARAASGWLARLGGPAPEQAPEIVSRPDGSLHLHDGTMHRRVRSTLLLEALELRYGPRRAGDDDEFATWVEGPPVEVLEGPTGAPFVVIAAVRVPVTNLPLPNPVRTSAFEALPEGPPLDVLAPQRAAAKALDEAAALQAEHEARPPDPNREFKALVDKEGVVRATAHLIRPKPEG